MQRATRLIAVGAADPGTRNFAAVVKLQTCEPATCLVRKLFSNRKIGSIAKQREALQNQEVGIVAKLQGWEFGKLQTSFGFYWQFRCFIK